MTPILRLLFQLSWFLGVLSIIAAIAVKALQLEARVHVTGHTLFIVAGSFFLCTLATREMQRAAERS